MNNENIKEFFELLLKIKPNVNIKSIILIQDDETYRQLYYGNTKFATVCNYVFENFYIYDAIYDNYDRIEFYFSSLINKNGRFETNDFEDISTLSYEERFMKSLQYPEISYYEIVRESSFDAKRITVIKDYMNNSVLNELRDYFNKCELLYEYKNS